MLVTMAALPLWRRSCFRLLVISGLLRPDKHDLEESPEVCTRGLSVPEKETLWYGTTTPAAIDCQTVFM